MDLPYIKDRSINKCPRVAFRSAKARYFRVAKGDNYCSSDLNFAAETKPSFYGWPHGRWPINLTVHRPDFIPNGVDLRNFLVAELARSFGFALKNQGAESLGDFRYGLSPRHLTFIPVVCDRCIKTAADSLR